MLKSKLLCRPRRAVGMLLSAARPAIESLESRTLLAADFTLATLSDTQYTVESFPDTFKAQTAWVAAHGFGGTANDSFANNIAFFAHQGDMLRRGYSDFQAANADAALKNLDGKVPYTVSIGNHDYDAQFDNMEQHLSSANFTSWFGDGRYQAIAGSGFGGSSLDQRNHFSTFTAGGREFLVLSLEWETSDASIAWGQSVINSHRQDPVIISTHEYLNSSGRTTSPLEPNPGYNAGEGIYQKIVKTNPQVFMVLSGHTGAIRSQTSLNSAGGNVYEIVADFEGRDNGGDGWMQLLSFDLAANTITGTNYSPTLGQSQAGPLFSNVNFNQRFAFYAAGAPIANDEALAVTPGASIAFDPRGNDVDADGEAGADAISFSALPAGVTYDSSTGLFTYAPDAAFRGDVSFTYTLSDGVHNSNTATVTLRANNAPTATADSAATPESKAVTINVLANDFDDNAADNAALNPILVSLPAHGAVSPGASGSFSYVPDPKFTGVDTFSYSVSDGKIVSAPVTVTVNVRPAAPVYNYPIAETTAAGTRTGSLASLTASDNSVESIREVISSGLDVDQRWTFNVTHGTDLMVGINAWRTYSNPNTGDEYHLQYSTNGSTWSDLTVLTASGRGSKDVTRTLFEANEPYQLWALPSNLSGTVYIRATDINPGGTETIDTLTVDEIFIRSGVAFPQVSIAATDGAETASNNRPVTFTVTRSGSGASIRNPLAVSYSLAGTATPGDDYAPLSGTVTIPAGQNSATFSIVPISDGVAEGTETIVASITADNAYDLAAASTATGNIADLDTVPPTSPANPRVTAVTSSSIALAWDASSDNVAVTGYDIYRNGGTLVGTVSGTTFTDTGLASNTFYSYTIVARDAAGNASPASNSVSARTTGLPAPTLLSGSKTGHKVKLTWRDNSAAESGFYVYSSRDGTNWTRMATVAPLTGSGGTQSYTTDNLSSGLWYFKVTTFNASGESDPSNIFNITL